MAVGQNTRLKSKEKNVDVWFKRLKNRKPESQGNGCTWHTRKSGQVNDSEITQKSYINRASPSSKKMRVRARSYSNMFLYKFFHVV